MCKDYDANMRDKRVKVKVRRTRVHRTVEIAEATILVPPYAGEAAIEALAVDFFYDPVASGNWNWTGELDENTKDIEVLSYEMI